eukprot:16449626-Heterocapsa_arctica.AAC.1
MTRPDGLHAGMSLRHAGGPDAEEQKQRTRIIPTINCKEKQKDKGKGKGIHMYNKQRNISRGADAEDPKQMNRGYTQ